MGIATRSSARVFTFSDWNDSATGIARRASVTTSTPFLQTPVPMSSPSQDPRADKIQGLSSSRALASTRSLSPPHTHAHTRAADLRRRVLNLHTKSSSVFKLPRAAPKLARDGSDGSWTGSLASLSSRRDGDYASSALLTSKSGVSTSVPSESGRPVDATAKLARSMIELLVLLLGHEIDTIAAWHNPTNAPHKLLPHQTEYSFEASLALRTDESAWMSHATVGWDVSPALAVQMVR